MKTKILRVLLIVVLSLLLTQPAYAKGGKPPQYDGTIVGPNGEIYYVDVFEEVGRPNFSAQVLKAHEALAAGGCKSLTNGVNIYNGAGALALRYQQKVDWCYDGTKITSVSHVHTPTVYIVTYRYIGLIGHLHSGGVGQTSYRAYSQAHFCMWVGACVWNVYPWVDQTVRGNGTYTGTAGF
ncbi:MAG TPA: hypothetical protein VLT51_00895 [Anaerolineales bacterium]|nr:hypothetical protein [Anaerolineales bacterium]